MDLAHQLLLFVISLIANIFSAFAGGGAGLIQLPALIFLGLPFAVALATHKVASVALGVGATLRHLREDRLERGFALFILVGLFWNSAGAVTLGLLGSIQWDWLPALLLGSLLGGYVGAHLAILKGNRSIKRVYEVITIAVGSTLIIG